MLRLSLAAVAVFLLASSTAFPDNIQQAKELPQVASDSLNLEAEASDPQPRSERCSSCEHVHSASLDFANLAGKLQAIPPGAEVHSQSSFEGCSTERGCAGIKVKDGQVVEKYGNVDAFNAASNSNAGGEFTFHAGLSGNEVLEGGIPKDGPYWWMKENNPFGEASGLGNYQKSSSSYSKSSSSSGNGGNSGGFSASLDISGNPFLNGDISKLATGFINGAQGSSASFGANSGSSFGSNVRPSSFGGNKGSASFGATSGSGTFGTSQGGDNLAQNPFLNGQVNPSGNQVSSSSFQSSSQFSSGSNFGNSGGIGRPGNLGFQAQGSLSRPISSASGSKFSGSGYVGSSPSPFTAATSLNQIENAQKASEFDFEQQQTQQNIDEIYSQGGGRVEHNTGEPLQTCAGQGYVCIHRAQCNNGVVNTNGASVLQARTKKQYCNTKTDICCRIETANIAGSGVDLQGSLGVGSAFGASSGSGQSIFGTSNNGEDSLQGSSNAGANSGSNSFQSTSFGSTFGTSGSSSGTSGQNSGASGNGQSFGASSDSGQNFGASANGQNFGASANGQKFGVSSGSGHNFGATGSNNQKGGSSFSTSFESSSSSFGTTGGNRGSVGNFGASGGNQGSFGSTGSSGGFGSTGSPGGFGSTANQGSFGVTGSQGNFDSTASQGNFGATSSQGNFGATSNQGNFGGTGSQGNFGSTANQGKFGATGSQGNFGATASQGKFGATGSQGNFGATASQGNSGATGSQGNFGTTASQGKFGASDSGVNVGANSASDGSYSFKQTTTTNGFSSGPGLVHIPPSTGGGVSFKDSTNTQTNFIETSVSETDSFSSGTNANGIYRPGSNGRKPGIPYLPPVVDVAVGSSDTVSSTVGYVPRPVPPTTAPGYLPPEGVQQESINRPQLVPRPTSPPEDTEGSLLLDQNRPPVPKQRPVQPAPSFNYDVATSCAAALKCTPIEYCTAEGMISEATVRLTKDQEDFRVPLTDCKDIATGTIGKCCRDGNYSDPWPTNQLGKWIPGVFGGDDGAYKPDSRGQPNNQAPVRVRPIQPPTTGELLLNNYRTTEKPRFPYAGPNQVTPGYQGTPGYQVTQSTSQSQVNVGVKRPLEQGQTVSQGFGQSVSQAQGQIATQGRGQYEQTGKGQFGIASQGQFGQGQIVSQSQGSVVRQGQGELVSQGQGQFVSQGQGQIVQQGQGQIVRQGQGQNELLGQGQIVRQGQGQVVSQGQGQIVSQGQGQIFSQDQGQFVSQGQGELIGQGQGINGQSENAYSESRVFLSQYSAGGQCGIQKGQKPYGNRNDLEVDFAEIPWQAMVLHQTSRSLLCGGVITRPDVVLTSASCVEGLQAKNVLIKGGEWKLGIDEEPLPFQIVQVKNILRHPGYRSGSLHNDVAILVLAEKLRLNSNIYPICLPNSGDTLDAYYNGAGECIVTGWGKQVLQVNIPGAIMRSLNISLINPGECQAKISQDYPHLLEQYDEQSCACGQPTNPINNVCKVDTGSALACTTGDGHFVLRGVYSWDSGCQAGNQLAAFYKFDLEWYEWAIGLIESGRFGQFGLSQQIKQQSQYSGVKGGSSGYAGIKGGQSESGQNFSKFSQSSSFGTSGGSQGGKFGFTAQGPAIKYQQNPSSAFSASYSSQEKQYYQSKPQIVTYTTKPEIVTYTTKPEIFTYTTKPKIVRYTTKPQIISYEPSGTGLNPQFVAPGVTRNPGFSELTHAQAHGATCDCLEKGK